MSRTEEILRRARDKVGDSAGTRYETQTLLDLLNDGLDNVSVGTKMFRGTFNIPLLRGISLYSLKADTIDLEYVLYKGRPVKLVSTKFMDEKVGPGWRLQTTSDTIQYIVFDKYDVHKLQVYPQPISSTLTQDATFSPDTYGVTVALTDFDFTSVYGVIGSIIDTDEPEEPSADLFGIMVDFANATALQVIYKRQAAHITALSEDPETPPIYDTMLACYIAGYVLRQDTSEESRALGNEELVLYDSALTKATANSMTNHTSASHHQTLYNGMG